MNISNIKYMKHTHWRMLMLVVAMFALVSCMDEEEVETSPECAIISFSVGKITSHVITQQYDSDGNVKDVVSTRTIMGNEIHFNIDQVNGRIYTVDSLPNWVDLTKVTPSFLCQGSVYAKLIPNEDMYFSLTSGQDTINFSKTVELMCVSTDGMSSKRYTVDIYKHLVNTDTLEWKANASNLNITGESKVYSTGNNVFVFAQNEEGEDIATVANSSDCTNWTAPATIPVSSRSIVMFNGKFYGLSHDGYIYSTAAEGQANDWEKAAEKKVERLLAADNLYIYAYDGQAIIGSADLATWSVQGTTDLDMLPETSVNSITYPAKANKNLQIAVMAGLSGNNSSNGVTWYKMTSAADNNQQWSYIQVTPDNAFGLPRLENLSTTYYKNSLYAIGTETGKYKYLYRSDDNGIAWHPQTALQPVPADLDAANGAASIATVGTQLWIIQENGKIWQGSIL